MKMCGFILSLIMLSQLDGNIIWVETAHLSIIKTHCHGKHGSVIGVGGRELCVRETVDQIREKIRNAGEHNEGRH